MNPFFLKKRVHSRKIRKKQKKNFLFFMNLECLVMVSALFRLKTLFRAGYTWHFYSRTGVPKGPIPFRFLSPSPHRNFGKIMCTNPKKGFGEGSHGPNNSQHKREQVEPSAIFEVHARPLNWYVVSVESILIKDERPPMLYDSFSPNAKVIVEQRFENALEPEYRSKYYTVYSSTFKWLQSEQLYQAHLRDTPPIYIPPFAMGNSSLEAKVDWERRLAAYEKKEALLFDRWFVMEETMQKGQADLDSEKNFEASGVASPDMGTEKASVVEIPTTESLYDSSKKGNSLPENPGKRKKQTLCQQLMLWTKNEKIQLKSSNLEGNDFKETLINYENAFQKEKKSLNEEEIS